MRLYDPLSGFHDMIFIIPVNNDGHCRIFHSFLPLHQTYVKYIQMKTILVPTDFSGDAVNACKYAIALARETSAKIILMHTFETPVLYSEIPLVTTRLDYATLHDYALNELRRFHQKVSKGTKLTWELVLQQGLASSRIIEIALEKKADLIVMGTTGKGSIERKLMGSNASRVIRNAPCLVLAVPPKAKYNGLKKIVYATDLLTDNLHHVKTMVPFAKIFGSEIMFLNIRPELSTGNEEDELKKITRKIKSHVSYPKTSGYVCVDGSVEKGINFFLKKHKADCLAMYSHHRNLIGNIFNPGITSEVAVHTAIPLLVIHESDFMEEIPKRHQQEKMLN